MFPPVDPTVLEGNANFDTLYKDLCARKLNPDGSTRDTKKQRMHDEIRRSLMDARINHVSSQLLISFLADSPSRSSLSRDSDLHTCIESMTALLMHQIGATDREILSGSIDVFFGHMETITVALSDHLCLVAKHICSIVDPLTPPSISDLSTRVKDANASATIHLPLDNLIARSQLTDTISTLLAIHGQVLSTSIQILEQAQHGALARHAKSFADLLQARAAVQSLQAKIHILSNAPPMEFIVALKEFKKAQDGGERALKDREQLATRELELYERAGASGLKDLAKRKIFLELEITRTNEEIDKITRPT